ncbi:MAG: 2-oxo acid dehydrogenase subunit E2 [Deltaproteobacteria bacterium]|nr:2-oxo acid dehydrogenase subunit E2 [Deltaproteobacteria bacterium]
MDFLLPTLGENIQTADVVRVLVAPGQQIKKDEPILELETAKAVFELPAPSAATVQEVLVKAGDKVKVGQRVMRWETKENFKSKEVKVSEKPTGSLATARDDKVLSPRTEGRGPVDLNAKAFASPLVRRLAREKGIDLSQVQASGEHGRILPADLEQKQNSVASHSESKFEKPSIPLPDFSKWGNVDRKPMSQLRLAAAQNLTQAWSQIPHVTQCEEADITEVEKWRKGAKSKLTMSAILIKILAELLEKFPSFNSSIDLAKEEIIYKKYKHVGVAVDTERGLVVPVIRDVDQKDVFQIAEELNVLSEKARSKKLKLEEMQGASITLSNLGGIGGTFFTPIVNWPEVSILGVCRAKLTPVWKNNGVEPRLILPLSLSYDHRVIDGADGIRFLRALVEKLESLAKIE